MVGWTKERRPVVDVMADRVPQDAAAWQGMGI
jgi:hypothetical protein